jgi:hypothetical protein
MEQERYRSYFRIWRRFGGFPTWRFAFPGTGGGTESGFGTWPGDLELARYGSFLEGGDFLEAEDDALGRTRPALAFEGGWREVERAEVDFADLAFEIIILALRRGRACGSGSRSRFWSGSRRGGWSQSRPWGPLGTWGSGGKASGVWRSCILASRAGTRRGSGRRCGSARGAALLRSGGTRRARTARGRPGRGARREAGGSGWSFARFAVGRARPRVGSWAGPRALRFGGFAEEVDFARGELAPVTL